MQKIVSGWRHFLDDLLSFIVCSTIGHREGPTRNYFYPATTHTIHECKRCGHGWTTHEMTGYAQD